MNAPEEPPDDDPLEGPVFTAPSPAPEAAPAPEAGDADVPDAEDDA